MHVVLMPECLGYEKGLFNNISASSPTAIDWTVSVTPVFIKTTDASAELFLKKLSCFIVVGEIGAT